MNFKKEVAVIAYLGNSVQNGYAVGIHNVGIEGRHIRVTVGRRSQSTNKTVMKRQPQEMDVQVFSRSRLPEEVFTVLFMDQKGTPLPQTHFVTLP
ncbi:MAG: hypothetical protein ACOYEP_07245 [Limnochordia bacterium]